MLFLSGTSVINLMGSFCLEIDLFRCWKINHRWSYSVEKKKEEIDVFILLMNIFHLVS